VPHAPYLRVGFLNLPPPSPFLFFNLKSQISNLKSPVPLLLLVIPNPPFRVKDPSRFFVSFLLLLLLHRVPHAPYLRMGLLNLPPPSPFSFTLAFAVVGAPGQLLAIAKQSTRPPV
jgi:hypothetical protein